VYKITQLRVRRRLLDGQRGGGERQERQRERIIILIVPEEKKATVNIFSRARKYRESPSQKRLDGCSG